MADSRFVSKDRHAIHLTFDPPPSASYMKRPNLHILLRSRPYVTEVIGLCGDSRCVCLPQVNIAHASAAESQNKTHTVQP